MSDADLLRRLRSDDERAFEALVDAHHRAMLATAAAYMRTREAAEDVVQEAWLGVLTGLDRFEGRSSLKTWIMRILVNTAMTRAKREARAVPFSSLSDADAEPPESRHSRRPRRPEEELFARETIEVVTRSIKDLPTSQRRAIAMRDLAGYAPAEVADALQVSDVNERVLLHRARSRVRAALAPHVDE